MSSRNTTLLQCEPFPLRSATTTATPVDEKRPYEQSRRHVSSVVLLEELLGPPPEPRNTVRYIEVPVVEEVVRRIPKHSVVEVEKHVPKYEVEYVDRIMEVPQVAYVDRTVEVPTIKDTVRHVRVKKIQDVPYDVIKKVPKIKYVEVEKVIQVPGKRIEVPKPYVVEKTVEVKQYKDKRVPVVVAQTLQPIVTASEETMEVPVYEYEPEIIYVDIPVPKPVQSRMRLVGQPSEHVPHHPVNVPPAQFNTLLRSLNSHLSQEELNRLPYVQEDAVIPFLTQNETPGAAVLSPGALSTALTSGAATDRMTVNSKATDAVDQTPTGGCWMAFKPRTTTQRIRSSIWDPHQPSGINVDNCPTEHGGCAYQTSASPTKYTKKMSTASASPCSRASVSRRQPEKRRSAYYC